MQKLTVFWKIQDICYKMGTEIYKIEEEMTEKMEPKVANFWFMFMFRFRLNFRFRFRFLN